MDSFLWLERPEGVRIGALAGRGVGLGAGRGRRSLTLYVYGRRDGSLPTAPRARAPPRAGVGFARGATNVPRRGARGVAGRLPLPLPTTRAAAPARPSFCDFPQPPARPSPRAPGAASVSDVLLGRPRASHAKEPGAFCYTQHSVLR